MSRKHQTATMQESHCNFVVLDRDFSSLLSCASPEQVRKRWKTSIAHCDSALLDCKRGNNGDHFIKH